MKIAFLKLHPNLPGTSELKGILYTYYQHMENPLKGSVNGLITDHQLRLRLTGPNNHDNCEPGSKLSSLCLITRGTTVVYRWFSIFSAILQYLQCVSNVLQSCTKPSISSGPRFNIKTVFLCMSTLKTESCRDANFVAGGTVPLVTTTLASRRLLDFSVSLSHQS